MPRRGRGGSRNGQQGKAYGQRSDLNGSKPAIAEYRGQAYGERKQQVDAQRAVPVAPPPTANVPGAAAPAPAAPAGPAPGTLGDLLGPTQRPGEPVTAGIASGPGPGPSPMSMPAADPDVDVLRAIYKAHPSTALLRLIAALEDE